MISTRRMGWARLPMLVAGVSLVSILAATAQTPPADEDPDMAAAEEEAAAAPDVNDADIMKDIDVSKLDWSLLNTDPSTLDGASAEEERRGERRRQPGSLLVVQRKAERHLRRVGQAIHHAVLGHADRRRHDGRPAGHADDVRTAVGKTRQWRQPAAIVRHRLGGDHRPRRGLDLGQDLGRSPRRSRHRSRASSAPP